MIFGHRTIKPVDLEFTKNVLLKKHPLNISIGNQKWFYYELTTRTPCLMTKIRVPLWNHVP